MANPTPHIWSCRKFKEKYASLTSKAGNITLRDSLIKFPSDVHDALRCNQEYNNLAELHLWELLETICFRGKSNGIECMYSILLVDESLVSDFCGIGEQQFRPAICWQYNKRMSLSWWESKSAGRIHIEIWSIKKNTGVLIAEMKNTSNNNPYKVLWVSEHIWEMCVCVLS